VRAAFLAGLLAVAPCLADEDEAWLRRADVPAGTRPLLAVLLDRSAATTGLVDVPAPFDPQIDYGAGLAADARCDGPKFYVRRGPGPESAFELEALDAEISTMLAPIPDERRQLVTGHGALGYFADRYGFRIVGTVIPGLSSADEPSARDIAELLEAIRAAGTTVVFGDVGTPPSVAEAVAAESGARLVELQVAQLPESGSYADLLRDIAAAVAGALVE